MNAPYTYLKTLDDLFFDIPDESIVSRTFYENGQIKAILFGFAAGQELSEHTASRPAILHFLRGTARLTLGEDSMQAEENTWVYMEPRLPHSIVAETTVYMLLVML